MTKAELQEKLQIILQCKSALVELHEAYGIKFAKSCSGYLQYTPDDLERLLGEELYEHDTRKEFSVGQEVTLMDNLVHTTLSSFTPAIHYKKGTVGWISDSGNLRIRSDLLMMDTTKVRVRGHSPEGIASFLYGYLIHSRHADYRGIDRALFVDRITEGLYELGLAPGKNCPDPSEVYFEDLEEHQFLLNVPDLKKTEDEE